MNPLSDILEDFGERRGNSEVVSSGVDESEIESIRLEAFENGFKAGWDDALKAQADDQLRISGALAQHLQDLSFTYHEASNRMLEAISPLLTELSRVLLPELARATIGAHIVEHLTGLAREIGSTPVQIAVSAANTESVSRLLQQDFGFPVEVVEDDTLADEQADIRFGQVEKQIDLGELVTSVAEAVDGFAHENRRRLSHG